MDFFFSLSVSLVSTLLMEPMTETLCSRLCFALTSCSKIQKTLIKNFSKPYPWLFWLHWPYSRVYQKILTLSDLAVGWQKVAFGVKTNTNTKTFYFGCRLTPIFCTFLWNRFIVSKNWHNSRTIGDRKLQHVSKVADHPSSSQGLIHFEGLSNVGFKTLLKN